jgi:ribose transport system permease protein
MAELKRLLQTRPYMFALLLSVLLLIANIVVDTSFAEPSGWALQLATFAPFALVAAASTPSIVSGGGGLDISIGPIVVFINCIFVVWLLRAGVDSIFVCIPILMAVGLFIGTVNGLLVTVCRFQPVIATLCTFFVVGGLSLKVATNSQPAPDSFANDLADKVSIFGVGVPGALFLLAAPVLIWFLLGKTSYHRSLYAIGGDDAAAYSAGVNVTRTRIVAYAIGGLFAAFAGIALTGLVETTQQGASAQYTLIALAAVALGGTPLGGGRGGLLGSMLGAAAIFLIQSLMDGLSIPTTWLQVVYGGLLIIGVIVGAILTAQKASTTGVPVGKAAGS